MVMEAKKQSPKCCAVPSPSHLPHLSGKIERFSSLEGKRERRRENEARRSNLMSLFSPCALVL